MKLCVLPTLKLSLAFGVAVLLLGCKAESTRAGQETSAVPAVVQAPQVPSGAANTNPAPTVQPTPLERLVAAPEKLSPGVKDVIDLAQSGVGDEVLLAFIANWPQPFKLSADEILYLTDLGLSEAVIAAMIKHMGNDSAVAGTEAKPEPAVPAAPAIAPSTQGHTHAPAVSIQATPEFDAGVQPAPEPQPVPAPQAPVQYEYFYSSLAPYGVWVDVPGYGLCWRPTVAVIQPTWKPYSDRGRWLYTDYGWYWQSDYSWGWAPFHYGRWWSHPHHGWMWAPDDCWGPSWVTWRYSDAYFGWAPLPPGAYVRHGVGFTYYDRNIGVSFDFGLRPHYYTYVPTSRFCDRYPWRYYASAAHVSHIHGRTKVVNNIQIINNTTIVNHGIDRNRVASLARTEIRKVSVQDLPASGDSNVRPERLEKRGSDLVVYKPQLPATPGDASMRRSPPGGATLVPSSPTSRPAAAAPNLNASGAASRIESRSELAGKPTHPTGPKVIGEERPGARTIPSKNEIAKAPGAGPGTEPSSSGNPADSTALQATRQPRTIRSIPSQGREISQTPAGQASSAPIARTPASQPSAGFKPADERRGSAVSQRQLIRTPVQPNAQREFPRAATAPSGQLARSAITAPSATASMASRPNIITGSPLANGTGQPAVPAARSIEAPKTVERRGFVPASPGFSTPESWPGAAVRSRDAGPNPSQPSVRQPVTRTPSIVTFPSSGPGRSMAPPASVANLTPTPTARRELPKAPTSYGFEKPTAPVLRQMYRPQPSMPSGGRESMSRPSYRSMPQPNRSVPAPSAPAAQYVPSRPTITTVPSMRAPQSSPGFVQSHQLTPSPRSAPQPAPAAPSSSTTGGGSRSRGELRK